MSRQIMKAPLLRASGLVHYPEHGRRLRACQRLRRSSQSRHDVSTRVCRQALIHQSLNDPRERLSFALDSGELLVNAQFDGDCSFVISVLRIKMDYNLLFYIE